MSQSARSLHIAVTGSTGLVGTRLLELLRQAGHAVYGLRRNAGRAGTDASAASWNPATGEFQTTAPVDVLIHLAGRNVATRWTSKAMREIRDSRVEATRKLAAFLAGLPAERRPKLLISASAIGIYGNRGDELLTESSPPAPKGTTFLSDVCIDWEAAAAPAGQAGIRVIIPRIGVVLAKNGGALAKLLIPARLGLAGPVGPATQFLPWISLTDLARLLQFLAERSPESSGPINAVAPSPGSPTRQHEFIRTLAHVLHRPAIFPLPSPMIKAIFGQMGKECLLSSLRVTPTRIPSEFQFLHTTLESAIRAELQLK